MQPHPFDGEMVVFDIETLAVSRRARVYEVGAVRCRFDGGTGSLAVLREGHWFLSGEDQRGREVNPDTMTWMHRTPGRFEALARSKQEGMRVDEFSPLLAEFFEGFSIAWCRGTHFDMAIMEDLFEECGGREPWSYHTVLDLRTLGIMMEFAGLPPPEGDLPHDALEDSRRELPRLEEALGRLRAASNWYPPGA